MIKPSTLVLSTANIHTPTWKVARRSSSRRKMPEHHLQGWFRNKPKRHTAIMTTHEVPQIRTVQYDRPRVGWLYVRDLRTESLDTLTDRKVVALIRARPWHPAASPTVCDPAAQSQCCRAWRCWRFQNPDRGRWPKSKKKTYRIEQDETP
jgi:hypothetical protein